MAHHHRNGGGGGAVVLNVAEKPSVARALAQVFSRMDGARDRGMAPRSQAGANQVFTHENVRFPSVFVQGQGQPVNGPIASHKMITTSVRGHLASQDFPSNYGWSKCDPKVLFDAPIETSYRDDMIGLERQLRSLSQQCTVLILWLDCDREGEAIGDEVREVCLSANPRLAVYRARFSTVMAQEIQRALKSLDRLNENFVAAVQARSELDLRVGAAFTRFQTLRLQRYFDGFSDQGVVSYGPCQFPTLGFVVERWARIETFRPETFWFLDLSIRVDADGNAQNNSSGRDNTNNRGAGGGSSGSSSSSSSSRSIHFQWKRGRLYDQTLTMILYESCLDAREAVVTSLQGRPKNKWRPVPLATVELQKRASRYLRIGSETLMAAAEELYQQGYISYPRTETERFRPEFQHRPLIEQLAGVNGADFSQYATQLLQNNRFQMPRAGQHDDQAHPPITPCKAVDPSTIQDQTQRKIYMLVVKHYLACCSRDAVGKETQLTVQIASEEFTAKGLMILERNWLEIYHPWERWSTGQGELPPMQVGSRVVPTSLLMKEGTTSPPEPISEVELISLMDRNGIGTDATIAQHISTIQDREYAVKNANQKFTPTQLGIALVEGYNSMGYQLNKPDLRRETEFECNQIAAGHKTKNQVVAHILAKMKQCYQVASQEARKLDDAVARHYSRLGTSNDTTQVVQAQFSECGVCHNTMSLKQERNTRGGGGGAGRNGGGVRRKLVYCNTCRAGLNLPRGQAAPKTENDNGTGPAVKCPICQYQVIKISRGDGYDGNGYHVCPRCFSDPPVDHGGTGDQFRCFSCQHPTCALATGSAGRDVEAFACPFCNPNGVDSGGKVCLRKNSRGFVLSCNMYSQASCPYTIWLPKECVTVSVSSGDENQANTICAQCSTNGRSPVRKVTFVFRHGSVPAYLLPETTTCVLCDSEFRREVQIALPRPDQVHFRPRAATASSNNIRSGRVGGGRGGRGANAAGGGRSGRGRGSRTGRGGGRGGYQQYNNNNSGRGGNNGTCFRCGQPGHFANNCPG